MTGFVFVYVGLIVVHFNRCSWRVQRRFYSKVDTEGVHIIEDLRLQCVCLFVYTCVCVCSYVCVRVCVCGRARVCVLCCMWVFTFLCALLRVRESESVFFQQYWGRSLPARTPRARQSWGTEAARERSFSPPPHLGEFDGVIYKPRTWSERKSL